MSLDKTRPGSTSKWSLLVAVLAIAVLCLAACDGGLPRQTAEDSGSTVDSSPDSAVNNHDPVTITWVASSPPDDPAITGFIAAFERDMPWITVNYQQAAGYTDRDVMEKVAALQAAGTPADVAAITDLTLGLKDEVFADLTPYVQTSADFQAIQFIPGVLDTMTINGRLYGVPYGNAPFFVFVNTGLLSKNGMDMPDNHWTYENFREMAKKATNKADGDWGIDGSFWTSVALPAIYSVANGSSPNIYYMNAELTQSLANTPAVVADLQWVKDLTEKDKVSPTVQDYRSKGLKDPFVEGKALFSVGGIWNVRSYVEQVKFEWDILPMPVGKLRQATSHMIPPIVMLSASRHKDAAFRFLTFLGSAAIGKVNIDTGGTPWVVNDELSSYLLNSEVYKGKNIAAIEMSVDMCCVQPGTTIPGFAEYNNALYGWSPAIINGGAEIAATVGPAVDYFNKMTAKLRAQLGLQ